MSEIAKSIDSGTPVPPVPSVNYGVECVAGLSTFLTMSYIFLLNPSLLAHVGIPPTAAFLATVLSALISTIAMGLYAKLPYAVAPVPTVTAFFSFYVCDRMKIPWQSALFAVFISGLLGFVAAQLSIRQSLIKSMPDGLKTSLMFAIGGFLIANGLKLANILPYDDNGLVISKLSLSALISKNAAIALCGLSLSLILNYRYFKFKAGPLVALIVSSILAYKLGIPLKKPVFDISQAFASMGKMTVTDATDSRTWVHFWTAAFVFFLVDFYGAIGKFTGLQELTKNSIAVDDDEVIGKALKVDSLGTSAGAVLGTSSVGVFISSAVGIMSGGKSGATALFCAFFILLSAILLPLVGSIPTVVNAGVLAYVGYTLIRWERLREHTDDRVWAIAIAGLSMIVSIVFYAVDGGLLVAFAGYSFLQLRSRKKLQKGSSYMFITTGLLALSVVAQQLTK